MLPPNDPFYKSLPYNLPPQSLNPPFLMFGTSFSQCLLSAHLSKKYHWRRGIVVDITRDYGARGRGVGIKEMRGLQMGWEKIGGYVWGKVGKEEGVGGGEAVQLQGSKGKGTEGEESGKDSQVNDTKTKQSQKVKTQNQQLTKNELQISNNIPQTPKPIPPPQQFHPIVPLYCQQNTKFINYTMANNKWRGFNIDIQPCTFLANGECCQLLKDAKMDRYMDFRLVKTVLWAEWDQLRCQEIPLSKSSIFGSKILGLGEKKTLLTGLHTLAKLAHRVSGALQDINSTHQLMKDVSSLDQSLYNEFLTDKYQVWTKFVGRIMKGNKKLLGLMSVVVGGYRGNVDEQKVLDQEKEFSIQYQSKGRNNKPKQEYNPTQTNPINPPNIQTSIPKHSSPLPPHHSLLEFLTNFNKFTSSCNIYSESPYLYVDHGTADISQSFSRIASLHGTMFLIHPKIEIDGVKWDGQEWIVDGNLGAKRVPIRTKFVVVGNTYREMWMEWIRKGAEMRESSKEANEDIKNNDISAINNNQPPEVTPPPQCLTQAIPPEVAFNTPTALNPPYVTYSYHYRMALIAKYTSKTIELNCPTMLYVLPSNSINSTVTSISTPIVIHIFDRHSSTCGDGMMVIQAEMEVDEKKVEGIGKWGWQSGEMGANGIESKYLSQVSKGIVGAVQRLLYGKKEGEESKQQQWLLYANTYLRRKELYLNSSRSFNVNRKEQQSHVKTVNPQKSISTVTLQTPPIEQSNKPQFVQPLPLPLPFNLPNILFLGDSSAQHPLQSQCEQFLRIVNNINSININANGSLTEKIYFGSTDDSKQYDSQDQQKNGGEVGRLLEQLEMLNVATNNSGAQNNNNNANNNANNIDNNNEHNNYSNTN